ncbi:hypothetical protein psyc5s11_05900 [Clostridium gelidum]|uniref:Uncharacterized protein n=1 Tax=Clostridium gelidum TaxID=704125 RepID=A0ABM7SYI4_9CLOT|nr:hypothetical protein psyc5s11_05900 [Clostridium gelidum]
MLTNYKFYDRILLKIKYRTLIKRGGGKGPYETRQPVLYKVPIPVDIFLRDKKRIIKIALFLSKGFFYFNL